MALRVNALYAYYICNQSDVAVDRLFDDICSNASADANGGSVQYLWDTSSYDLMVTERAIEALVDYYDYCKKNHLDRQPVVTTTAMPPIEAPAQKSCSIKTRLKKSFPKKRIYPINLTSCQIRAKKAGSLSVMHTPIRKLSQNAWKR